MKKVSIKRNKEKKMKEGKTKTYAKEKMARMKISKKNTVNKLRKRQLIR